MYALCIVHTELTDFKWHTNQLMWSVWGVKAISPCKFLTFFNSVSSHRQMLQMFSAGQLGWFANMVFCICQVRCGRGSQPAGGLCRWWWWCPWWWWWCPRWWWWWCPRPTSTTVTHSVPAPNVLTNTNTDTVVNTLPTTTTAQCSNNKCPHLSRLLILTFKH